MSLPSHVLRFEVARDVFILLRTPFSNRICKQNLELPITLKSHKLSDKMTFCPLCKTLGLSKLVVSKDGKAKKLYSRLEKDNFQTPLLKEGMAKCYGLEKSGKYINQECRPKKIFIENYEIHGRNVAALSIFDLADLLLQKDFPQIANFNKERRLGPIFLPNNFIPKIPKSKIFENQGEIANESNSKKFPGAIGDSVERQVFETLKLHFLPKRNENVMIIQGM